MLTNLRNFRSFTRLGALSSAAAILLNACGGSAGLGDGPAMLNENLPSGVTVGAAPVNGAGAPGSVDARYPEQGPQPDAPVVQQAPDVAQAAPAEPALPAYGAAAAVADGAVPVVYPPSGEENAAPPADAPAGLQDGATAALTPAPPAPLPQA